MSKTLARIVGIYQIIITVINIYALVSHLIYSNFINNITVINTCIVLMNSVLFISGGIFLIKLSKKGIIISIIGHGLNIVNFNILGVVNNFSYLVDLKFFAGSMNNYTHFGLNAIAVAFFCMLLYILHIDKSGSELFYEKDKYIKCENCGHENWDSYENCEKCNSKL